MATVPARYMLPLVCRRRCSLLFPNCFVIKHATLPWRYFASDEQKHMVVTFATLPLALD
jgi:hypothetical protein